MELRKKHLLKKIFINIEKIKKMLNSTKKLSYKSNTLNIKI